MASKIPRSRRPGGAPAAPDRAATALLAGARDPALATPDIPQRSQSLRGFDPDYTDIADYITRSTRRIHDEVNPGLIYSHYTSNAIVYSGLRTSYSREDMVRATLQRSVELPEQRTTGSAVIWSGDDEAGFYTSQRVTSTGRHSQPGAYGEATGRRYQLRGMADRMVFQNRVYREWQVHDTMALVRQLGLDPAPHADQLAREQFERGMRPHSVGEDFRQLGQYPPSDEPDLAIARTDSERHLLRLLHGIYNRRIFGDIRAHYAPQVQWHGPGTKKLVGTAPVMQAAMRLVAMIPNAHFEAQHICSLPSSTDGGRWIALRWMIQGHHLGHGFLGPPTGYPLSVMGISHVHLIAGRIVEEWTLHDEFALLVQIRLAELSRG